MSQDKPTRNVFYIGLISFFGGISQDIFVPVLPLYLKNIIGMSSTAIGISEGIVTAGASIFKLVAGYLTDRYGKKKPFIALGYGLSLIARPLLAIFTSTVGVYGLRLLDGIGKGMKDAPKSALVAESSDEKTRGKNFGIARTLDTLGSVAGPLILFALLAIFSENTNKYQIILGLTALPLMVTLAILKWKVKETQLSPSLSLKGRGTITGLPKRFYAFLAIMLVFAVGNSSDAFLALRAQNLGVGLLGIPLVFAVFNLVYASCSIPLGSLSDRIGREKVIVIGLTVFAFAYLGFGFARSSWHVWLLFAFYGIYYATTEGVAKAFVADLVPREKRGSAYGVYQTALGLVTLPAGLVAGLLWDKVSPAAPFYFGSLMATIAVILFAILATAGILSRQIVHE